MIFECHSIKQQTALLSDHPITVLLTGIQFGKTTVGALWMKRQICKYTNKSDAFIITAPNYKTMQQSTLPAFLNFMEGMGSYHKVDAIFQIYNGGLVYLRTATEPDSVVGITNVRAIWGDEAGKYSLYFWENVQSRASFKQAPILLTTTPYTANWLYKSVLRQYRAGKLPETLLIEASSNENPYFPKEEFEKKKLTMDPRRFAALFLGQFEKMHGLVYDVWDEEKYLIKPFQLPQGTKFCAGVDWGYTDPFVLLVRAITPNGYHFQISEFYKTGMTVNDMIIVAKQKKQIYGIKTFFADPSQPGYIDEFNRNGLTCVPANNDIRPGIDAMYELIRSDKFKVFENTSPYTLDEFSTYHYPEPDDLDPNQDSKEMLPVGQNDHTMDASRYITIMTYKYEKKIPIIPDDSKLETSPIDHTKKLAWLTKRNKKFKGAENW